MAEESKVDYVHMGSETTGSVTEPSDPDIYDINNSLSQEEKDLRLSLALQQAENEKAYASSKKRHEAAATSHSNRTIRSNASTSLSSLRATQKANADRPLSGAASDYYAPSSGGTAREVADAMLASDMQRVEQATAGTARMMAKIQKDEDLKKASAVRRTGRSGF